MALLDEDSSQYLANKLQLWHSMRFALCSDRHCVVLVAHESVPSAAFLLSISISNSQHRKMFRINILEGNVCAGSIGTSPPATRITAVLNYGGASLPGPFQKRSNACDYRPYFILQQDKAKRVLPLLSRRVSGYHACSCVGYNQPLGAIQATASRSTSVSHKSMKSHG